MAVHEKTQIPLLQKMSRRARRKHKKQARFGSDVAINIESTPSNAKKTRPVYERSISVRERYSRVDDTSNVRKYAEELLQKAVENDYDGCQALLEKGDNVNVEDKETKSTALHIATKNGQRDIVILLLSKGADCNAQDGTGQSPLHLTATKDHVDCCEELLKCSNLKVNIPNKTHDTPLHQAAKEGRIDICTMLLEHADIDVKAKNKIGMTPLHLAAHENHKNVIQLLMNKGANCNTQDRNFHLPLHYAAQKGFPESCEVLLSNIKSADREKQLKTHLKNGKTPLMLAAQGGHHKCCVKLTNTYINAKDKVGNTALHLAAAGGYENTIAELLNMGAKANTQNIKGSAPVLDAASKKNAGCLKILVEKDANLFFVGQQNKNVLHYAAEKNSVECLTYLLSLPNMKSLLDKKDDNNCTPLHISIKREAVECAHILLENNASPVEQCIGGMTPLHLAADKGYISICEILLAKDEVKVSQENDSKATPLHLAALHGSAEVCQMLLRKGARLSATDGEGRTPLHIASLKNYATVVKLLTKKGAPQRTKDDTGSTALHLAASKGSLECCQVLAASAKAVCNDLDHNGNRPLDRAFEKKHDKAFEFLLLHMPYREHQEEFVLCLHEYMHTALTGNRITAVKAIIDSSWWEAGFTGANGHHCLNFRQLVECHPSLALKVQDKCVQHINDDAEVTYDFRFLEDNYYILSDSLKWKNDHPLSLMISHTRHQLLHHPLVNAWLLHKWRSYIYIVFLACLLLELIFVTCLIIFMGYIDNWMNIERRCNFTREQFCEISDTLSQVHDLGLTSQPLHGDVVTGGNTETITNSTDNIAISQFTGFPDNATLIEFAKCNTGVPVKRGISCVLLKKEYLFVENLMQILRVVFTIVVLIPGGSCEFHYNVLGVEQWECGILALLVEWLYFINMLNQLPMISVFMPITRSFLKSFFKVLFYIIMLVFIFAFIFHLLLRDQAAFHTVPQAMVKTIVWMLGDLAYDDTFLNDVPLVYPVMVNILFVLFVTTIGGFIVNLVVAQPSEKLNSFRDKAAFHRAASRCRLFLKLEVCFPFFRKFRTRRFFVGEETTSNGSIFLTKKLLRLDNEVKEAEPENSLQLQLLEQNKQMTAMLNLQKEEIHDLKQQLNIITKYLPGRNRDSIM
ncbi:Transient receptor potential cation channel subfamily A member 1-like 5 [Homarus americanus]|uniref:Transient receptor potential cation channel subfamily A member 1-like 5 n=1 Tax=Homarus americanus TaxID=6706 RepID=A0A8J5N1P2_HOMAM|nr:Transient receptor potential cation channel subfamily A member 1-like 5 [Homarus americanus]